VLRRVFALDVLACSDCGGRLRRLATIAAPAAIEKILPHVDDPEVRALFSELGDDEATHQALVRREVETLPPDPAVAPDAFEDEPTTH